MTEGGPPLPPPQAYLPPPPPPVYPAATYYQAAQLGPAPGIVYAGFWIRFLAAFIDGIIVFVPFIVLFFLIEGSTISSYVNCVNNAVAYGGPTTTCATSYFGAFGYWELIGLGVQLLYFVVLWSQFGGTLGQRMLGLHVVDAGTGRNIGIGRALGRFLGYIISSIPFDLGLMWAGWDPRKQGWHDKMASTFVVRKA
jgi:uncharacterized RDD family membrane protein YckC